MKNLIVLLLIMLAYTSCKSPEARRPVSIKTGSIINQSIDHNKKINREQHEQIKKIIKNNPEIEYIASPQGFWYYYNTKIEEAVFKKPGFGDFITYDYNVKSLNGTLIYSKEDLKTQNYIMEKQELFTGLREGLKLMRAGETVTFLFPSQKAYGYYGDENKIGRNIPLICEVTVNSITLN